MGDNPLTKRNRPKVKRIFIEALTKAPNITRAAEAAGIDRDTAYRWRKEDEEFAAQWEQALNATLDNLEQLVYRRASIGAEEPVYYKGEVVGHVRKPSDILAMFWLKAHRPELYRERYDVTATGDLSITILPPDDPGEDDWPEKPDYADNPA